MKREVKKDPPKESAKEPRKVRVFLRSISVGTLVINGKTITPSGSEPMTEEEATAILAERERILKARGDWHGGVDLAIK